MTFTYFKKTGEIHFDYNGIDDHDGDEGYYFDYEIDDIDVQMAVAEFICDDYIFPALPGSSLSQNELQEMVCSIWNFISNNELFNTLSDIYSNRLREKFEQKALESRD